MKTVEEIAIEITEALACLEKLEASNKMIRNLETRLLKLEAASNPLDRPWRRVICDSGADCEAQKRAMIESGQAQEGNNFIFRIIIDPPARTAPAIPLALAL
jgi:hypothetical protein